MSWFKKVFSSQSSQETNVVYQKVEDEKSNKTDNKQEEEDEKIIENQEENQEENSQSSQSSWWSSWGGLSYQFTSQKRELSDDEENEEKWWESFCSSPDKDKDKEEPMDLLTQTVVDKGDNKKEDNKKDDDEEEDDEGKVEFFVKIGKNRRFKYYWFFFV